MKKYLKPESETIEMELQGAVMDGSPIVSDESAVSGGKQDDAGALDRSNWGSLW